LFRSTAQVFGPNVIGVVLTGSLDDGTAGLWTIKRLGGIAVVQDPADAVFPSMPTNAIRHVDVDHVVPTARMASLLTQLTSVERAPEVVEVPPLVDVEVKVAKEENPQVAGVEEIGKPSPYACPDCSGVLLEIDEGGRIRFRCHTGHAYSSESLLAAMNDGTDAAMGVAVRALEEASLLMEEVARHLKQRNELDAFRQMLDGCDRTRRKAEAIRELILERDPVPTTE
jgi:two-component system chemotaxis response regulator CheB